MVNDSILNIGSLAVNDDSIIRKEIYQYTPYSSTSFSPSDEIRICIQNKDAYLLPCESYIHMKIIARTAGTHTAATDGNPGDAEIYLIDNYGSFLFSDVRYELNNVEIDRVKNVGRSSIMKLRAASRGYLNGYSHYCKAYKATIARSQDAAEIASGKVFDVVIPLSAWFGFCDDYRKIIVNCKHELVLNLARNSFECVRGGGDAATAARVTLSISKIEWKVPIVTLSDKVKLNMMGFLSKSRKIPMQYRSMEIFEYPLIPTNTTSMIWPVKTVSHVNRPRYVIVGLQEARKDNHIANASTFDICEVTELRLHLNSQIYPYNMGQLAIADGIFAELYNTYSQIQSSYYNGMEPVNPFNLSCAEFQNSPLFVFDTSRADESLINSAVDIKIEIKTAEAIPNNTAAYCVIIYQNEFTYSPFEGIVMRSI